MYNVNQSDGSVEPIFILGVPRSGTTLLRAVLGAHSEIAGIPETPWLLGTYGGIASVRELAEVLIDHEYGLVRNVRGTKEEDVLDATRHFIAGLFRPVLERTNKKYVIFKTPDDIKYLEFLVRLYPDASYIHICRDGRDVAASYLNRSGSFLARHTALGHMNFLTLLRRWYDWETKTRRIISSHRLNAISIRYEELVTDSARQFEAICRFLGVVFEPSMLRYAEARVDLPDWEAGSRDVREAKEINTGSVERWRQTPMTLAMAYALTRHDDWLVELGYHRTVISLSPLCRSFAPFFPWLAPMASTSDHLRSFGERAIGKLRRLIAAS